ncbi:hypothetical protein GGR92_005213 [Spirosoma lacussanchae]|uniref:hypothetical protein n=1 Tax=Spirosoma lacussanchae TaxID=1884249 RepID=UPI001108A909|nr:hypothetical protein [Spirosoma lacussanchae]
MNELTEFFKTATLPPTSAKNPFKINAYVAVEDWDKFLPDAIRRAQAGDEHSLMLLNELSSLIK